MMRIGRLEIHSFPVPFKIVFRHASANRTEAENLIVVAYSDCGQVGFGEGCPRDYVTGETVEGGAAFFGNIADDIRTEIRDEKSLRAWIRDHSGLIDKNPAAFCAVEIALLDLLGKVEQRSIESVVGARKLEGSYGYSAVLGDAPALAYWWQFRRYWRRGFRDFKVKVSGDLHRDRRKINVFRTRSDSRLRVRLDANNLWTSAQPCIRHIMELAYNFHAIEEPLEAGDLEGFKTVGRECRAKIILDESLLRLDQLSHLNGADPWLVNVRVSKMGGILRSLDVAEKAAQMGIGIIVGAQVGETSILTRAALTVMSANRANLVAAEGAFGTHLLQRDLAFPCLMFGHGGYLDTADTLSKDSPGLGLKITEPLLVALARE